MKHELTQQQLDECLLPAYLTSEQRDAILSDQGNLLLSASAGSGKTFVLSSRVVYRLSHREKGIDADKILVVTFTRAAAKEMRQRITDKLSKLAAQFPEDEKIRQQIRKMSRAKITTIDSFCSNLVREHFDVLDLSPDFYISDQTELEQLLHTVLDELLEEQYQGEDIQSLSDYFSPKDDWKLKEIILRLYRTMRTHPFPLQWLKENRERYRQTDSLAETVWGEKIFSHVCEIIRDSRERFRAGLAFLAKNPAMQEYLQPFHETVCEKLSELEQEIETANDWDTVREKIKGFHFPRRPSAKKPAEYDSELMKREDDFYLKPARNQVNDISKKILFCSEQEAREDLESQRPYLEYLFDLTQQFYQRMDQRKREKNCLDFPDLGIYAIQILLEPVEGGGYRRTLLGNEISKGIQEILVDEVQDINHLQDLLFRALSIDGNNLFFVGDVKQSIYSFRLASPELFLKKYREYHPFEQGKFPARLTLAENFRSRDSVTNAVNYLFRQLMTEKMGEVEYDLEQELRPAASYPEYDTETELHLLDLSQSQSEDTKLEQEADYVARLISRMLRDGYQVKGDNGEMRPCRLNDFAVLLRSTKGKADIFVKKMLEHHLDVWTESSSGYFQAREVSLMLNLLRVIDNPLLDIPLMSVLMSPMFGFTADHMAQIRVVDRKEPLYRCILLLLEEPGEASQDTVFHCREFVNLLTELRQEASLLGVEQLIQKIYDETLFYSLFATRESSEQKLANLRLLLHYASSYEQNQRRGLSGFIRYIDRAQEANQEFESANIFTEQSAVVRVMSIHKSKGLEFPICILANCSGEFYLRELSDPVYISSSMGVSMKHSQPELLKQYKTVPYLAATLFGRRSRLSEEMRVLYVGMTRAREKLILTLSANSLESSLQKAACRQTDLVPLSDQAVYQASSYADWILLGYLRHPDLQNLCRQFHLPVQELRFQDGFADCRIKVVVGRLLDEEQMESEEEILECDWDVYHRLEELLGYRYPFQSETELPAKLSVTQITKKQSEFLPSLTRRPDFQKKEGLTPAEKGTATHQFVQFADFESAIRDLEGEILRMVDQGYLDSDQAEALDRKGLNQLFSSSLVARMKRADRWHRELSFFDTVPVKTIFPETDSEEEILVQGIADCVLEEGDGLVLIDYKTDHASADVIRERYREQMALYRAALEKMFEKPVKECIIYAISLGKEIQVNGTEGEKDES